MNLLKLVPLVLFGWKNVSKQVANAGVVDGRPWYLQRSVVGAIVGFVSSLAAAAVGVTLSVPDQALIITDWLQIIPIATTLYGIGLSGFGLVMKIIKQVKGNVAVPKK
jgi:hypothetical protein